MDANGTRYLLLLGQNDWASCTDEQGVRIGSAWNASPPAEPGLFDWDGNRGELTLHQLLFEFPAAPNDRPPALSDRRGAARDRYGNWYWIATNDREILATSVGTGTTSHFWSSEDALELCRRSESSTARRRGEFVAREQPEPPVSLRFSGMAVTNEHYLVVGVVPEADPATGDRAPAGLLIFDLHAGGTPRQLYWPESIPFVPWDMAPSSDGGVWVLDCDNQRYWALDRQFNVLRQDQFIEELAPPRIADFQPDDGSAKRRTAARTFPRGILLDAGSPLVATSPIAIEALPDGTVMILDAAPGAQWSLIYRYRFGILLGEPVQVELGGHDFAFVPGHTGPDGPVEDRLYIVSTRGNQAYGYRLDQYGEQLTIWPVDPPEYLPMRLFGGKGLVAAGDQAYYDFGDSWVPLVEQQRPRYVDSGILYTPRRISPEFITDDCAAPLNRSDLERPAFDGREPDCVWHRLMLDACIPEAASVIVWSRAANDERTLGLVQWQREPELYLRGNGSELPYLPAPSGIGNGTWEVLFQRARGRYLQLKIKLIGNGRTTPHLRALRAYYPRFSYLDHYLPAVYREDQTSASFLDRFLANMEGFFTTIEDRIAAIQILFDVRSAPPETLDWLATWFGVALDPAWDEARRRLFIKYAMVFFQYRGTIPGLRMALRLALDPCADETIFTEVAGESANAPEAAAKRPRPASPNSIRLIERFRTRSVPSVVAGDPTEAQGVRLVMATARWSPRQGAEMLHQAYRDFISGLLTAAASPPDADQVAQQVVFIDPPSLARAAGGEITFPLRAPAAAGAWARFTRATLGFVPAAESVSPGQWLAYVQRSYITIAALNTAYGTSYTGFDEIPVPRFRPRAGRRADDWAQFTDVGVGPGTRRDQRLWQEFLQRRYQRPGALRAAYGIDAESGPQDFGDVLLPGSLPPDGPALLDWYQFEEVVLAMRRLAHQFTVLLPMPPDATRDLPEYQHRLALARRVVDLEKPAHTIFDVKLYWALFRIGEARLGEDTLLDRGSRAPQLMPPLIVGRDHLAESYLAPGHPQNVEERYVVGRQRLSE